MKSLTYRQAIISALADELESDPRVFLIGEDIAEAGGAFKLTEGLHARFGSRRILNTPIAEQAIVGCAIGAAMRGLRPVAEIMFADFAGVCFDQIANQAAKFLYMTNGQISLPMTIRMANGAGAGFAAQHSQAVENWFLGIPGLKIAVPGTPADAYRLLRAAIRDPNPVLVFEHKNLFNLREEFDPRTLPLTIGGAEVVLQGDHVTIVATQQMRQRSVEAAGQLREKGIGVEVIDLRVIAPLDIDTVRKSVSRTNRLLCVQEGPPSGGWAATVVSRLVESDFELFDAPPTILSSDETPVPFAENLEQLSLPTVEKIAEAATRVASY